MHIDWPGCQLQPVLLMPRERYETNTWKHLFFGRLHVWWALITSAKTRINVSSARWVFPWPKKGTRRITTLYLTKNVSTVLSTSWVDSRQAEKRVAPLVPPVLLVAKSVHCVEVPLVSKGSISYQAHDNTPYPVGLTLKLILRKMENSVNAERCVCWNISSRYFQSGHCRCVCPWV